MGECYNPGDSRRLIERIEVIRIRPRLDKSEDVIDLVEDVWKSLECRPAEAGCVFEFDDPDFVRDGRNTVYYVRAIEASTELVNADNLRCDLDENGVCARTHPCRSGAEDDECLAYDRARAWSSPIFVDQG